MAASETVAVVTGGSAGIGRAVAETLATSAMIVVNADVAESEAHAARTRIRHIPTDVTDGDALAHLFESVLGAFGRLDVLVNNAGVAGAPGWERHDHPRPSDWAAAFEVNVLGTILCMEAVRAPMREAGGGRIVNVASISGRQGRPMFRHYAATKAAVIQLTRSAAPAFAREGIAVNAVAPGLIWTPMWTRVGLAFARHEPAYAGLGAAEVYARMTRARVPLARGQTPESVAATIAFLASAEASGLTGQVLNVDGGITLD